MKYALITGANSLLAQAIINNLRDNYHLFLLDHNPALRKLGTTLPLCKGMSPANLIL